MLLIYLSIHTVIALKGNLEIVKILVNAGALLNRTTRDGRTALYLAVQEGKKNTLRSTSATSSDFKEINLHEY